MSSKENTVQENTVQENTVQENTVQENASNPRALADVADQFFLGAALGLVLAWIPLAISIPDLKLWNFFASIAIILTCASLSALFGKRVLGTIMSILESFPPIA
jgi:hypothetical protein